MTSGLPPRATPRCASSTPPPTRVPSTWFRGAARRWLLDAGLTFPEASAYAEVPAGTYTLDVNAAGTNQTALTVPHAALASGGVYSAFAVGTVYADSLNVLLVQDNGGGAASATATASASSPSASSTASPSASATGSATVKTLPDSGGGTWLALPAALALMGCGLGALALVRRSTA